ncbi:MAG: phosphotransferase [Deltaproteobacteria bacterium]|jgi:Ser/Thr protein kinase RdoA (MazF antagonist)|nr:phosphotransferase [Deltaproteobacteria bacterium]
MSISLEIAKKTAAEGYGLVVESIAPLALGRVNESFQLVSGGQTYCLQRLNDFFEGYPALGDNWLLAQAALQAKDWPFPSLQLAKAGETLWRGEGFFRLTRWLKGEIPKAGEPQAAYLAGRFLGQCHRALNEPKPLANLEPLPPNGEFTNQRLVSPEDFEAIFSNYRRHPRLPQIAPAIVRAREAARRLPGRPAFRRVFWARDQVIHADPKRENFLFAGQDVALVDWDTLSYGDPLIDLGELCRSFAVLKPLSKFHLALAVAAVEGYLAAGLPIEKDVSTLLPATIRALALSLARRYLIDALAEVYFSWDKSSYPSLFSQNEARALALLNLAEELEIREMEITKAFTF